MPAKPNKIGQWRSFALTLPLCFLLSGCNQHRLPPITNPEALRQECRILFEQFPVSELSTNVPDYEYQHSLGFREIPQAKWPASISNLHPYLVCSYQGGVQMWIYSTPRIKDEGKYWNGYYVAVKPELPPPPQSATNHFVFQQTDQAGILLLKQLKF